MKRKLLAITLIAAMTACSMTGCGSSTSDQTTVTSDSESIENALNLANNEDQTWTYSADADAWVLSIVCAVTNPEIEDEQGVSVCVPGAYVTGIDTTGDGKADTTSADSSASEGVKGSLVIDYDATITSTNGQTYTAATAPVIVNTGAAGYASSTNTLAATTYAKEGYINMSCGNRGKQDTATDSDGNTYYTGDAPSCLVDQKNAIRYVKYNILLGNLPGSVDYFVSTGGSGGGAHATMVASTGDNSDYYDYEIEAGAVGVYSTEDGYSTTVTIDGKDYEISDGVWGCIAYSAITSLAEADMAMAFEYYMDTDYDFNTDFQAQMAQYLSAEYMEYINDKNLSIAESAVGFDINEDGDTEDTVDLTIEYDTEKYADTNGYGGTYLTLYLDEFQSNLQSYLDNLDYADGWTWFNEDGSAMTDQEVAAMTAEDKATAFIEGRYSKSSSSSDSAMPGGGAPSGDLPSGDSQSGDTPSGDLPSGDAPSGDLPSGDAPSGDLPSGDLPSGDAPTGAPDSANGGNDSSSGDQMEVGTPDAGTTQGTGSSTDSANYSSFEEMLESYESDIESIEAGDEYGNNIVDLYNPLNYIGDEDTQDASWVRIVCGAAEGDISMFNSLNLEIAMLNAGIDCTIEWQWDGGHVPSEILGDSLALYVDEMYGKHVDGATQVSKAAATATTTNGDATAASGTDLTSWVSYSSGKASFSLADAVSYRTSGASKATPGFDVMDYGQEDYVFGTSESDARHWDKYVLKVLQENSDTLSELWNKK